MSEPSSPMTVGFNPNTPELRAEFEAAYLRANVHGDPAGSERVARRVEAIMRQQHPDLIIKVETGPTWIVWEDAPRE